MTSDSNTSATAFDRLINDTLILSLESQQLFAADHCSDQAADSRWDVDLSPPARFWFNTTPPRVFTPHFIGSVSHTSNTWLWGWENINNFDDSVVAVARQVRDRGVELGISELTTARIDLAGQESLPDYLTFAAEAISGIHTFYRGPTANGSTYFLIHNEAEFVLPAPEMLTVTTALAGALDTGRIVDARRAVASYGSSRGYGLRYEQVQGDVHLGCPDGTVRIEFDEHNRVSRIATDSGGVETCSSVTGKDRPNRLRKLFRRK